MGNKPQEAKQDCLRQIVQMPRADETESYRATLLGEAARSSGVRPVAPPLPNLSDPALYLDFFGQTLDYAVFPHKSRCPVAAGSDVSSKTKAWGWICVHITLDASQPRRMRRSRFDQFGIFFAGLFHKISDCRLPICSGPSVAHRLLPPGTLSLTSALRRMVGPPVSNDPA